MNTRTRIAVILIVMSLVLLGAGVTAAFVASASPPVINTFTVGDIRLSLSETTGTTYQLIPGTAVSKDPRLTVKAGNESCWLFFKANASQDLTSCVTCTPADGWTALQGYEGVYYRQVGELSQDQSFPLLLDDRIYIKADVTEQQLAALQTSPTLSFTGYAIQTYGVATAEAAWQQLMSEGVTVR